MILKKLTLGLSFIFFSHVTFAESWSMHISEEGITKKVAEQPNQSRQSNDGVVFTDSTTYYVDKSKQQYYASIIGATVSSSLEPQNVQYAPVFNIKDPNLDREVKSEEQRNGKVLVNKNLKKNKEILSNVVCK